MRSSAFLAYVHGDALRRPHDTKLEKQSLVYTNAILLSERLGRECDRTWIEWVKVRWMSAS